MLISLLVRYILQEIQHVDIWDPISKLGGRERMSAHHQEGGDDTQLRASSVNPPRSSARILCKRLLFISYSLFINVKHSHYVYA